MSGLLLRVMWWKSPEAFGGITHFAAERTWCDEFGPPRCGWKGTSPFWRSPGLAALVVCLVTSVSNVQSQSSPIRNPRIIEFDIPNENRSRVDGYRIELFQSREDTSVAVPIKAVDVRRALRRDELSVRVDLRQVLEGVPDGEYVATLRTLGPDGPSARSEPTAPFLVSGGNPGGGGQSVSQQPGQAEDPQPSAGREEGTDRGHWFWTAIGIAIGVAAILIPYLAR